MSNPTNIIIQTAQQLQMLFHRHFLSELHTGDPVMDGLISYFVFTLTTLAVVQIIESLKEIRIWVFKILGWVFRTVKRILLEYINRPRMIELDIHRMYGDKKQVNELYEAFDWYIKNQYKPTTKKGMIMWYTGVTIGKNTRIIKNLSNNKPYRILFGGKELQISYQSELQQSKKIQTDKNDAPKPDKTNDKNIEDKIIRLRVLPGLGIENLLNEFVGSVQKQYQGRNRLQQWRQQIHINIRDRWIAYPSGNRRRLDSIILKKQLKEEIVEDIRSFVDNKKWYEDHDINYTRGYLFRGDSGTGKTSMIKALSLYFRRNIHILNLNEVLNETDLITLLSSIDYQNTVLVIESVPGREEPKKTKKTFPDTQTRMTPGLVFGILDEILNNDGMIVIMTASMYDEIDDKIIRPGMIDKIYSFERCDGFQIMKLHQQFYGDVHLQQELSKLPVNKYTPADVVASFLKYKADPIKGLESIGSHGDEIKKTFMDDVYEFKNISIEYYT